MANDKGHYRQLYTRLWHDLDFRKLSAAARFVYVLLATYPRMPNTGIFHASARDVSDCTGLSVPVVKRTLGELRGWIFTDGEWVWVRNAYRFDAYAKGPKNDVAIVKQLRDVPSRPLVRAFCDYYSQFKELSPPGGVFPIGYAIGYRPPIVTEAYTEAYTEAEAEAESETPKPNAEPEAEGSATPIQREPDAYTIEHFMACFNETFGRRTRLITADVREKWEQRLKGWKAWQLVALPIVVDAQGVTPSFLKSIQAEWLLRDGQHPRTGRDGRTVGATNWAARAYQKLDQTKLGPRHVALATRYAVLDQLIGLNAIIEEIRP